MKRKIIIISGPTAVGKTDISIKLAQKIGGEIISADSVQVYKGMDIGSAKIKQEEMQGIKHYLVDCLEPDENFDVSVFKELAQTAAEEIYSKGKTPIVVGGTAFYIQALLYDINFNEENHDNSYREEMDRYDNETLYNMLVEIDPEYAASVHMNNKKRVIRALEYNHFTGKKFSLYNQEQAEREAAYDFKYFVLNDNRDKLYEKINRRVDLMVSGGLVDEVAGLKNAGYNRELVSMQGIGYKEIYSYLEGECSLEQSIEDIKKNTRHFAKRQLTWFRHEDDVIFIDKDKFLYDDDKIVDYMINMENYNGKNT